MQQPNSSEDAIFVHLREAILGRQLSPGTRLREIQICEILGASRGTVRKVLRRLAFEGLVDLKPNRGASVAQPTAKDAADLFAARKCVETAIACAAARNLTPAALAGLKAHIALERTAKATGNADAIVSLSGEFHLLVAVIADNSALKRFLDDIIARESLIIQLYERAEHESCAADDHAGIVEALQAGDPDLIAGRIEGHIDGIAAALDLERTDSAPRSLEDILGNR